MISICAPIADISGQVVSHNGSAVLQSTSNRAKRVATLDGSAVLVGGGFSSSDLTYQIIIPDKDGTVYRSLLYLLEYHSTVVLSCALGCYSVLLSGLTFRRGSAEVIAEVLEEI